MSVKNACKWTIKFNKILFRKKNHRNGYHDTASCISVDILFVNIDSFILLLFVLLLLSYNIPTHFGSCLSVLYHFKFFKRKSFKCQFFTVCVSSVGRVYSAWPTVWWWSFIRLPGEPWPAVWWRPFGREVGLSRNTIQTFHETQASRLNSIPFHETQASQLNSIPFHETHPPLIEAFGREVGLSRNTIQTFTKHKHHDLIQYRFTKHIPLS